MSADSVRDAPTTSRTNASQAGGSQSARNPFPKSSCSFSFTFCSASSFTTTALGQELTTNREEANAKGQQPLKVGTEVARSDASVLRVSTPGRLRSLLMDASEPVLILGAGASITSGIPAAGKTVDRVARWAWCKENGRHPSDISIRRSDYWPWIASQPWYRADTDQAELYPDAIDNLLGVKSDRREFFEQLINPPNIPPSRGYVSLTQILHQGWISTVLTTNFDACLTKAAIQNNRPHRLPSKRRTTISYSIQHHRIRSSFSCTVR